MPSFGYRGKKGPSYWGSLCKDWEVADSGRRQSPINICTGDVNICKSIEPIKFEWSEDPCVVVENNGKSPTYYVSPGKHFIQGGPLDGEYELFQYHLHFSNHKEQGSEHSVDGQFYPAEIHFVHFKTSYGSFVEATKHPDGLAVVGAFVDVDLNGNYTGSLEDDLHALADLVAVDTKSKLSVNMAHYKLAGDKFYTYEGSLTAPGCAECVIWILLRDPLTISQEAYDILISLESTEGGLLSDPGNVRPIQPLYDRNVTASFSPQLESHEF